MARRNNFRKSRNTSSRSKRPYGVGLAYSRTQKENVSCLRGFIKKTQTFVTVYSGSVETRNTKKGDRNTILMILSPKMGGQARFVTLFQSVRKPEYWTGDGFTVKMQSYGKYAAFMRY